jgi:hypothetical protein
MFHVLFPCRLKYLRAKHPKDASRRRTQVTLKPLVAKGQDIRHPAPVGFRKSAFWMAHSINRKRSYRLKTQISCSANSIGKSALSNGLALPRRALLVSAGRTMIREVKHAPADRERRGAAVRSLHLSIACKPNLRSKSMRPGG